MCLYFIGKKILLSEIREELACILHISYFEVVRNYHEKTNLTENKLRYFHQDFPIFWLGTF